MHAASVNPEPGSNSLKNCISNLTKVKSNIFFRAIYSSFFLLFEFLFLSKCINEISALFVVLEISCCSIFNDRCAPKHPLALRRLTIIPDYYSIVKGFFNFFHNFFYFGKNSNKTKTYGDNLSNLHTRLIWFYHPLRTCV